MTNWRVKTAIAFTDHSNTESLEILWKNTWEKILNGDLTHLYFVYTSPTHPPSYVTSIMDVPIAGLQR